MRHRLAYVEGIRKAEDTDSQRFGTSWHALHEEYGKRGSVEDVFALLNERYSACPNGKDLLEWELEREILTRCFLGYLEHWKNDPYEVIASEVPFELPLAHPGIGLNISTSEVVRVGKIDQIVEWRGNDYCLERKTTSRSVAPDSDYWQGWRNNTQVSMYALAVQDMCLSCSGVTLVDVLHKPTIRPKALTQKDTQTFLETGGYCDEAFQVSYQVVDASPRVLVGDSWASVEASKTGFAIRETVQMFGARLSADMRERPDFYFARREIARTDAELVQFEKELFNIYQTQKMMAKYGTYYSNESACRATFHCPYIPVCFGEGADAACAAKEAPAGFRRMFVDLTISGVPLEEE